MASSIGNDEDFMDRMKEIKSLLKDDSITELKSTEAELLRTKIMDVLKYVMSQIEGENNESAAASSSQASQQYIAPGSATASMQTAGAKKKRTKKQKGGVAMDTTRINNTGNLDKRPDPYQSILTGPDIPVSLSTHRALTSGTMKGFSSVSRLSTSDLNTMLPSYGTRK